MESKKTEGQVTLNQMLKALDKDVAVGIEKRLNKLTKKAPLKAPLDKNKADQVERRAAYSNVTKEVTKWEPIVEKHRRAKQLKFPLDQEPDVLPSTADALGELKPSTALEKEVQDVVNSSKSVLHDDKELTKAEEKYLKAISVEEAQERHRELQKMRVLLSSYAAKMRRQKLIKSKSYRRLLKHEKIRRHVKKVESDKDLLVEEIERLQRLRARERASLKHKNTGKWAKHAKFRAKYDDEARKAMLEQIGLAEKLLEKPADSDSDLHSDSESDSGSDSNPEDKQNGEDEHIKPIREPFAGDNVVAVFQKTKDLSDEDEEMGEEEDDDDDQRKLMSEAFADDDVVAEFQTAKDQLADEEQPKDVNLFLPGWGDWAGPGIKINKRKRNKYIIKAKKIPRRDDKLGNVIISEQADNKIKEIMIKKLPRGIKNDEQLAKILAKPVSATFINQTTHRDSIKPRVETKMGARIEPMNKKMLQGNKAKWA